MPNHYSSSQFGTFCRCAEQWRRRYIEGDKSPPGIALHIGSGLHYGAEINYEAKMKTRVDEPLDVVLDAAVTEYDAKLDQLGIMLSHDEVSSASTIMGEGKDKLVDFTKEWHAQVAPLYQPKFVEEKFLIETGVLRLPILGFLDLFSENGELSDLKSASRAWNQRRADTESQMTIYGEAIKSLTGEYPKVMRFDTVVSRSSGVTYEPWNTKRSRNDYDTLLSRMKIMEDMIQAGSFPPTGQIGGGFPCGPKFCGYWGSCQYVPDRLRILPRIQ